MNFTVAVAAYNAESTLAETLASVHAQTERPSELLVVDDGSTDGTADLIRADQHARLISQPNGGVSSARNAAIAAAAGDVVAFLDSDDVWHPRHLEFHRRNLEEAPEAVASFLGHFDFLDGDEPRFPELADAAAETVPAGDFLEDYNVRTGRYGSMTFLAARRGFLESLGERPIPTETITDDHYLCHRMALAGPVVFRPVVTSAYRVRRESLSDDRLKSWGHSLLSFDALAPHFARAGGRIAREFARYRASRTRQFASLQADSRQEIAAAGSYFKSLGICRDAKSLAVVAAGVGALMLPRAVRPSIYKVSGRDR